MKAHQSVNRVGIVGGVGVEPLPQFMSTDAHFRVKISFKFRSLGKIPYISTFDPLLLLGQFQHWVYQYAQYQGTKVTLFFIPPRAPFDHS